MSSNYEWQRHQTNEWIQIRLNEAHSHRLAKKAHPNRVFFLTRLIRWLTGSSPSTTHEDNLGATPESEPNSFSNTHPLHPME